jgi:hypothetical protein
MGSSQQATEDQEEWLAELQALRPSALRRRARELGLDSATVDRAEDGDDPEAALLDLILSNGDAQAELRNELRAMTLGALKKRARLMKVDPDQLDDADDADDTMRAVVGLILSKAREKSKDGASDRTQLDVGTVLAPPLQQQLAAARGSPKQIVLRYHQSPASGAGRLCEALDADAPQAALVELLLGTDAAQVARGSPKSPPVRANAVHRAPVRAAATIRNTGALQQPVIQVVKTTSPKQRVKPQRVQHQQPESTAATAQHASAIAALADEHAAARAAHAVELAQAKADADAAVATLRTEMDSQRTEHCEASEAQAHIGQIVGLEKVAEVARLRTEMTQQTEAHAQALDTARESY